MMSMAPAAQCGSAEPPAQTGEGDRKRPTSILLRHIFILDTPKRILELAESGACGLSELLSHCKGARAWRDPPQYGSQPGLRKKTLLHGEILKGPLTGRSPIGNCQGADRGLRYRVSIPQNLGNGYP